MPAAKLLVIASMPIIALALLFDPPLTAVVMLRVALAIAFATITLWLVLDISQGVRQSWRQLRSRIGMP